MNIGINIFNLRTLKGIKQSEMAEKLGMEQSGYSRIEKRGNKISYDLIEKIAEILGVTPAKLLSFEVQSEEEKVKKITTHQIEISTRDQLIDDLRKVKEIMEESLEDFCDMIEHEIRMMYENALYTELGKREEEVVDEDGNGTGGFTFFTTNEEDELVFHNNILKNKIIYDYFNKGFYRYSEDHYNVVEEFLPHFKSYNPQRPKSKICNTEFDNDPFGETTFLIGKSEEELITKLLEFTDRIKDKDRIIKMSDGVIKNIIDIIDDSIEDIFLEIIQMSDLLIEDKNFGKIWKHTHGMMTLVPLHEFFEQPFFIKAKVSPEYKNLTLLPEEVSKIIKILYESEVQSDYKSLLAGNLIYGLYEHDNVLEKSKYLKYFRDFNKSNVEGF